MNASLLCLLAALSNPSLLDFEDPEEVTVYAPADGFQTVVRGQSPFYEELPGAPQTFSPDGGSFAPFQPAPPAGGYDPFLGTPGGVAPDPFGGPVIGDPCAVPCPPPQRFGWIHRYELGFIPRSRVSPGRGRLAVTEFDAEWRFVAPLGPGHVFSFAQQFDVRWWDGPEFIRTGPPPAQPAGLPGTVYRIGWDLALASAPHVPWGYEVGFTPSINTDFDRRLTRRAWNLDARAILFFRPSPFWTIVAGVEYWDRVRDYLIPHVGVVWSDQVWEWRLVFPRPEVSVLLGYDHIGIRKRLYLRGELNIEAWEIELDPIGRREQIEMRDWRVLAGLRMDRGPVLMFIEGGWVFEREARFARGTPGFDINSGFIGRLGVQF